MSLIKWRESDLIPRFSGMVENLFRDDDFAADFWTRKSMVPLVNIKDTAENYIMEFAVPGLKKDDFNVELKDNMLCVSCEKELSDEKKDDNFTRKEFSYEKFSRSFWLPENVKADKIEADYRDGVLMVTIPKLEVKEPNPSKKIKIG
ncbi:MAG: Hsp20/alpha crystallin family protein [Saprospiraceae bacterium]|nr:Hsp20/alpha crystallin family protein [Saprospiraceae bacterium]